MTFRLWRCLMLTSPRNGGLKANFEKLTVFFLLHRRKTKSAQGQLKTHPNKKVEENQPAQNRIFFPNTSLDFEVEYLTEPYCTMYMCGR